jgi:hypothetical protein
VKGLLLVIACAVLSGCAGAIPRGDLYGTRIDQLESALDHAHSFRVTGLEGAGYGSQGEYCKALAQEIGRRSMLSDEEMTQLRQWTVRQGSTREVVRLIRGRPHEREVYSSPLGPTEVWRYGTWPYSYTWIYFRDGRVAWWDQKD